MTLPCLSSLKTLRASLLIALLIAALTPNLHAVVGRDWTLRTPLPTAESMHSVALKPAGTMPVTPAVMVAVGNFGEIWTSEDAVTWTKRTSGTMVNLLDVIYAAGKFVAVGEDSVVLRSADGITWVADVALGKQSLYCIAHNNSYFVACGWDGKVGIAQISLNGTDWTQSNPAAVADPVIDVTNVGSILFAVTSKNILRGQINGGVLAWTKVSGFTGLTAADMPVSIATTAGNLVLSTTSTGGNKLWSSGGGVNWNQQLVTTGKLRVQSVGASGEIIAVGAAGEVWTAANGAAPVPGWTARSTGDSTNLLGGGKLGTTYVVTGETGRILTTTNTTWTDRLSTSDPLPISDAASNGSGFVTVSANTSRTSPDGTTWTSHAVPGLLMESVTHTGTQYVAAGDGAWTSPDGIAWTETLAPDDFTLYAVRWLGTQVIAVGSDVSDNAPVIYTSPTGAVWTKRSLPTAPAAPSLLGRSLEGVTATGGLIVAVGDTGLVLRSIDGGATWVKQAVVLGNNESFTDIAFAGNLFSATTNGGSIWTSPNGSTWTKRQATTGKGLNRILVVGNQFFATGQNGATAYSFGGLVWQNSTAGSSQTMQGAAWNGTTLIVAGDAGTILSSAGGQPVRPALSFALATSSPSESLVGGIQQVQLNLTPASTLPVTVLFTLTGTATQGASATTSDYKVVTTPITFTAGQTSKLIDVTIFSDKKDELDETAIFSLGTPTGDAGLGATKTHTLTILDDDQIPLFTVQPTTQFVTTGTSIALTASVQGSPTLVGTWKKNNGAAAGLVANTVPVVMPAGATLNGTIATAALTHAGAYTVEAKNDAGKTLSSIAYVGVVDNTNSNLVVPAGATMVLSVKAAGQGLTYRWEKVGDGDLSNSTLDGISGATTTKLTIKDLGAADSGTYRCRVTMNLPNGTNFSQNAATTIVAVETSAPVVTTSSLPPASVAEPYDFIPIATNNPNKWTLTGLPPGLVFSTSTGRITGKSTASGTFGVTFKATNVIGEGQGTIVTLTINALPTGSSDTFLGLADRNANLNKDLGGRLEVTTTPNGLYTGKLVQGNVTTNLTGGLTWVPGMSKLTGTHVIPANAAAAMPASTLNFELVPATSAFTASTTNGTDTALITTWANTWLSSPPATVTGLYNFVIKPLTFAASFGKPQGHSIGSFTIANDGTLTVAGRLADNTVFTTAGTLSPNREVALYSGLYNSTGSLHGLMTIVVAGAANADNKVTGTSVTWSKAAQAATSTTRSYKAGFGTMTLPVDGGRYTPVGATERFLLITKTTYPNIEMFFADIASNNSPPSPANSSTITDILFQVFTPASLTPPLLPTGASNPGNTTATINNDTGEANGNFTYVDSSVSRTGTWFGIAIRPAGITPMRALGFYVVPEKTTPDSPNQATTPIASGDLFIQRN